MVKHQIFCLSPPPQNNYADYFCIREFEKMNDTTLLIFIGELGASDGSDGLYKYLLLDTNYWKLDKREMLFLGKDMFDGNIEKELFIFKKSL